MLAGLEIRRRWRRVVALVILVGAVGACVLAVVAGARRTSTSLERFRRQSRSADVELAVGEPSAAQLRELDADKSVAATAALRAYGIVLTGLPTLQALGVPVDATFGTVVDRGRIVDGRAVDPSAADEVVIGESLAAQLHAGVGGRLRAESYSPSQIAAVLGGAGDVGPLAGPSVRLRIVGIERRPLDLSDRAVAGGFLALSPAFGRAYAGRIGVFGSYLRVRTRSGAPDSARAIAVARRVFGKSLFDAQSLAIENEGARDAIRLLSLTLWIFGGVAALAGVFVIGIVLSREISLMSADYATARVIGLTRRQRVAICGPFTALVVAGGAMLAVLGAVSASPIFPIGVARRAEPSLGIHGDWTTLTLGVVALGIIVLGIAFVAALRITGESNLARDSVARHRTSKVIAATAGVALAPTIRHGLRMAFESGSRKNAVPVRSTFAGAALGVLGVTAVLVFASSLDHLVATPRLYGWTWDFKAEDTTANTPCGGDDYGVSRGQGLAAVAEVCRQNMQLDGRATSGLAFTSLRGAPIDPEVLEGRAPRGPREIALGSTTIRALGKSIGDTVRVRGRNATTLAYEVVGRVVLPTLGQAQPLSDGAVFTGEGLAPLFDQNLFSRYFVGRFTPGADIASVERRIAAIPQLANPAGPTVAVEVDRVRQVDAFPAILAALMGGLALLAVGHALVTAARRRRRELAILKVIGFDRRQVQATVAWQATTLATVGLVVGIPAGLIVGTFAWRLVADGLGVAPVVAIPWLAVLLTIPGALVLVNVTALLPARAAARTLPAVALRSE